MSLMDKVKEMFGQHPDQAKSGVDKAGDMFDQRTGGKYADKVDKAQERADQYIDHSGQGRQQPTNPPQDGAQGQGDQGQGGPGPAGL
ncbi:antitoxin [Actinomadura logoneensis]|uniref:Antitoxin n=1 Tax=Actinomadura logoneensis TaxID=2293572 RepID=A0A372JCB8_9ACTN|nr:antitoxin [Actinomadura logoneensis]RFU37028.1 antitoxin [Actinomadura logoneensis]